jgi:hypothetical protein
MKPQTHTGVIGIIFILLVVLSSPSHADDHAGSNREILTTGEKIVLDAVVLRPVGLVTTVAGTAIYAISLPFSLLGGNEAEVREHLIYEPARYTFKRPLGDIDY